MPKTLAYDHLTSDSYGIIRAQIKKLSSDGDMLGFHIVTLVPGCDVDAEFANLANDTNLVGFTLVSAADIARVKSIAAAAWTPEFIAAYQALIQRPA